jgi:hypothetical protein
MTLSRSWKEILEMILRLFFYIPYHFRFPGYLGYQKSGINIAPFNQQSSFWGGNLVTWIFRCILAE